MDNSTTESIVKLYDNANTAVLWLDTAKNVIWKNKIASSKLFDYAETSLFRKSIFSSDTEQNLEKFGSVYLKPGAEFADPFGIMLIRIDDGTLMYFDNSTIGSALGTRFPIGGFDSFSGLVRGSIDKVTLSAASVESAINTDDPEIEQLFSNIRMSSYKILRGLNNASLISKYVSGTLALNKRNCDIGELVGALCLSIQSILKTRIDIKINVKESPVIASVDIKLCERAMLNIIANAIMYSRDENHLSITVGENKNNIRVVVKDWGAGIKEENVSMVTKPYFSVEPADDGGEKPGLGLGLSVASVFCETHGGTLIINSRFGEGTTVAMSFENLENEAPVLKASVSSYVTDKFSPVYIELCELCEIPR
ncbi:MAG: HAMP domain-containing sensor histidine kinase [Oscillospiraceae bacterium]